MLLQEILAGLTIAISPVVPPVLVPLAFAMVGALLVQHADPWTLAAIMILSSRGSCMVIRLLEWYILQWMAAYKVKHHKPDALTKIWESFMGLFMKKDKISRTWKRIENYMKTPRGKVVIFLLAVFCTAPTVPDIITVRIFRTQTNFRFFFSAAIFGKIISFVPFIFLGQGILWLLKVTLS